MNNSEAARQLGLIKTAKKSATSAANGRKGARPQIPIEQIECTCGTAGDVHKWSCRRYRTLYQRERRARRKV